MTLIFYDTETTGLNTAFDQVLQFSAIRTDDDLNELGRFDIRSRLLPYVIPSPGALRTTGMTIDQLIDEAHPSHYEMVCRVRDSLAKSCPATFIGYNSLKFDEELLRQAFYQCLHPPYMTNTGGSTRADALHLVKAAAFLHPGKIVVPLNEKGRPTFRLDQLAPANGFDHTHAHDALSDTEATIFLCRLVKDRCPELWVRVLRFSHKATVVEFLREEDAFAVLEFSPARVKPFVVTAIGDDLGQSNTVRCYDLAIDPDHFRGMSDAELARRLVRRPNPLRRVKVNAAPTLCPLREAPEKVLGGTPPSEFARRARAIREEKALVGRLLAISDATATTYDPSPFVERQIYDGFWSRADERRLDAFHAASWEGRAVIAEELEDGRLAWLARRLIFVERPHLLADHHRTAMATEKARRMIAEGDERGGWTTLGRAGNELAAMLVNLDDVAAEPFRRLGTYFDGRRVEAERVIGRT